MQATLKQDVEMVKLLLRFGGDPLFKAAGGPSALELAQAMGGGEIFEVLKAIGAI